VFGPITMLAFVSHIREWAESHPEIVEVWIIGSQAKGTATPNSDLDLTVELEPRPGDSGEDVLLVLNRAKWAAELTELLGMRVKDIQGENVPADPCYGEGRRTGISVFKRQHR
jgi:predicted nucleotidyltransferase